MTRSEALDVRMTGLETEMRKVRSEINLNFEVMSKRMAELFEAMCHKLDKLPADATSPPTGGSGIGNGPLMESGRQESRRNLSEELLEEEEKESERESLRSDDAKVEDISPGGDVRNPGCLSEEVIDESQTEEAAGGNSVDRNLQRKEVALQFGSTRVNWSGEGSERRNPRVKLGREIDQEKLAGVIRKAAMEVARERQPSYWILGLTSQRSFEPVALLQIGFEFGPVLENLGPPPWYCLTKAYRPIFHIIPEGKDKIRNSISLLEVESPLDWPKRLELGSQRQGLSFIHQLQSQADNCDSSGQSKHDNQESSTQMCAAPARPPPQPPDFPWLVSSGKKHASSEDPGDLRVFWPALLFRFKHHLADKAVLKGPARLSITPRESEEVGFVLLPPPEPPPLLVADWGWTCIALVADKYGARYDSRGNQMSTNRLSQLIGASWESYVDGLYLVLHPALFIAQLSHFVNAATSIFYHSPRPPDASCSYIQP